MFHMEEDVRDGCTTPLERRKLMKHKVIRIALVVAEAFVALWAVIDDVALVTGAIPFNSFLLALLQGTPFSDYTIPGWRS
jgi:hypothetical protein